MMEKGDLPTFEEFPLPRYEDWVKRVEKSLKGVTFDKLVTKTYEDIAVKPIYCSEDTAGIIHIHTAPGFPPYVRGNEALGYVSHPWEVSQEFSNGDPVIVASMAKQAFQRGQTSFHISLDAPSKRGGNPNQAPVHEVGKHGVSLFCLKDVETLLAQVKWEE